MRIHFEAACVIGDMVGQDGICGHYQSYANEIQRPFRMCNVTYENIDNPYHTCNLVNAKSIFDIVKNSMRTIHKRKRGTIESAKEECVKISQHPFLPAFEKFAFGGCEGGIFQCTPVETLHALLGVIEKSLISLFEYTVLIPVSEKGKKKRKARKIKDRDSTVDSNMKVNGSLQKVFWKEEFNRRVSYLAKQLTHQSDRSLPRTCFKKDITTLSGYTAQEMIGLSLVTIFALPGCLKIPDLQKCVEVEIGFCKLLWRGISLYYDLHRYLTPKLELEELELKIRCYQNTFIDVCGDQKRLHSPSVGTKFRKLHSLIHFADNIADFGSAHNFFGGYLESLMKDFVKQPSKRTRKWMGHHFLLDISKRWSEMEMVREYHSSRFPNNNTTLLKDTIPNQQHDNDVKYVGSNRLLPEYSNVVKIPKGTTTSSTVFTYVYLKDIQRWCTQFKERKEWTITYNVTHPYMNLNDRDIRCIKSFLNQQLKSNLDNPPIIECSYYLKFNIHHIDQISGNVIDSDRTIIKALPGTKNKSSWFDWIKVSYGDEGYGYGQVRLLMKIFWNKTQDHYGKSIEQRLYVLTHMLENFAHQQKHYHFIPTMKVDKTCR